MKKIDIDFLKQNKLILFEAISGSKAFGLATEKSDTDIRGVFYLPKEFFYGIEYIPQISNETNDIVYYEIGRFIELLLKNNPNILEILATPEDCILYKNPIFDKLKIEDFLSKLCKDTFGGYAFTQIQKARGLNKKIVNPMDKKFKTVLDFCYILDNYSSFPLNDWLEKKNFSQENFGIVNIPNSKGIFALFYDGTKKLGYKGIMQKENTNDISLSSIPKGEKLIAYLTFNKDAYSSYCKEYKDYWNWVEKRNEERYNTNQEHGKNYDSKNMMHTIRLLQTAENILKSGTLNIRVENREELLDIKSGKENFDVLISKAEEMIKNIESLSKKSSLSELPNDQNAKKILVEIRTKLYS